MKYLRALFGVAVVALALYGLNRVIPVVPPASCPPPVVVRKPPPIGNPYEIKVIQLTNIERNRHGLQSLKADPTMMKFARNWSAVMAAGRMHHSKGPYGENVAKGYPTPEATVRAWMLSPGHRRNILSSRYTMIGVGQVGAACTQVFR